MSLNVFVGNIGSGKSFLASKFARNGAVVFNMDAFQEMIGGGEYGLYDSKKKGIYHHAEEETITKALQSGFDVVVDRTNMDRKRRERFIEIGRKYASEVIAYDWGSGTREGLSRRIKNPYGIPADQWADVFGFMYNSYEAPTEEEGFSKIIEAPKSYKFYAFDFDGTIVENNFPEIGEIIDGTVDKLNALWEQLSNIIIVWTCRDGDYVSQIRKFMIKNKIPFDFINENPLFEMGSRKIFAHRYYDDRNEFLEPINTNG